MKTNDGWQRNQLTFAEETVLKFLRENKGVEFSTKQLGDQTGIKYFLIKEIMYNLAQKEKDVYTNFVRGVHVCKGENSWLSMLILAGLFLFMFYMFGMAFLNYLDEEPHTPQTYEIEAD